jgi:hypothetical protein
MLAFDFGPGVKARRRASIAVLSRALQIPQAAVFDGLILVNNAGMVILRVASLRDQRDHGNPASFVTPIVPV